MKHLTENEFIIDKLAKMELKLEQQEKELDQLKARLRFLSRNNGLVTKMRRTLVTDRR
jgi:uncharacterized membrane protein YjjP (DUF1212 family)